jgi:hypothetical protein
MEELEDGPCRSINDGVSDMESLDVLRTMAPYFLTGVQAETRERRQRYLTAHGRDSIDPAAT